MTAITLELEGLSVEISHPSVELEKRKLPLGALTKFKCSGCGRRTLSIEEDDIKRAGAAGTIDKPLQAVFDMAKIGYEISRDRKSIEEGEDDFIAYSQKIAKWRNKWHAKREFASNGGETDIGVSCPLCGTAHTFRVRIVNPVEEVSWSDPNILETYEKRGIAENERNLDLLTKISYRFPPYEHAEAFLAKIEAVSEDRKMVQKVTEEIKAAMQKVDFKSDLAQAWLRDLQGSFDDVTKILREELEGQLRRYLATIQEFATSIEEIGTRVPTGEM